MKPIYDVSLTPKTKTKPVSILAAVGFLNKEKNVPLVMYNQLMTEAYIVQSHPVFCSKSPHQEPTTAKT